MNTHTFFDTLGKRVRILREDRGLNQIELAQKMRHFGVTVGNPQISKIEAGVTQPSVEVLAGIAKALHASTDYLLLLSDNPELGREPEAVAYITPEADEIARIIDALPVEIRQEALAIARRLARPVPGRAEREQQTLWWLTSIEQVAGKDVRRRLEDAVRRGEAPFSMSD